MTIFLQKRELILCTGAFGTSKIDFVYILNNSFIWTGRRWTQNYLVTISSKRFKRPVYILWYRQLAIWFYVLICACGCLDLCQDFNLCHSAETISLSSLLMILCDGCMVHICRLVCMLIIQEFTKNMKQCLLIISRTLNGLNCADVSLNNIHPSC